MDLWLWWSLPFSFLFIFSIWFSLCFAAVLPPSGSFDRGVNSVFVDLPLNSKAYFHCTSFDYSYRDWKVLHDNIRYSPLDDILIRVLLLIMNLFSLFKLEFMCISLSEKSIRHNSFPWFSMACLWCCHYSQKLLLSFVPKAHCAERYHCPHQRVIPSFYHPFYFKKLHSPTLHNFFGQFSHFGLARRKLQFSNEMFFFLSFLHYLKIFGQTA